MVAVSLLGQVGEVGQVGQVVTVGLLGQVGYVGQDSLVDQDNHVGKLGLIGMRLYHVCYNQNYILYLVTNVGCRLLVSVDPKPTKLFLSSGERERTPDPYLNLVLQAFDFSIFGSFLGR